MSKYDFKLFRRADIFVYLLISSLALVLFLIGIKDAENGCSYLRVSCGGETKLYSISEDASYTFTNNGYTLVAVVENGGVYVSQTDCPDEICRLTGKISRTGQSIICVPAEISLSLISDEEADYDAVTH